MSNDREWVGWLALRIIKKDRDHKDSNTVDDKFEIR